MSGVIRRFETSDTDAVVALWEEAGLIRPWNDPLKDIARKQAVQPELFLVLEDEGRVLGTAMSGYDGHRGWVYYLAVATSHRGRGLGRSLMTAVEERLLALGCPKINLMVRAGNEPVFEFYRSLGYAEETSANFGKRLIPDD